MQIFAPIKTQFMKYFLIALTCLLTHTAIAQQFGRAAQRGQRGYTPPARDIQATEPEKPDANQVTQERAVYYAKELELDAFTMEVVKSYMKNYYTKKFDIQYNPELKYDDKIELLNLATKDYENELATLLPQEKVDRILVLESTRNLEKAEKKKKKRKKRKKGN